MVIKKITELWISDKAKYVKESTISAYALLVLNHINPYFGNKSLFKQSDLQDFVLQKAKIGLSIKSIKDIIVVIKMIQLFAVDRGLMKYEHLDIKYPKIEKKSDLAIMSKEQQKKFVNYLIKNINSKNIGLLICIFTGMRIGEICSLKWSDIDFKNGIIRIRRTIQRIYIVKGEKKYTKVVESSPKTKQSNRDIPIANALLKVLKEYCNNNSSFYVISDSSNPIEPRVYRNYYDKMLTKLNITKI